MWEGHPWLYFFHFEIFLRKVLLEAYFGTEMLQAPFKNNSNLYFSNKIFQYSEKKTTLIASQKGISVGGL